MSLLSGKDLSQSLGSVDVFQGISVSVAHGAKIGLIGANGIGKTTLLRVLAGADAPTYGAVHVARGRRVGYLRQEAVEAFADHANTLHAEMLAAFARVHAIEARMREIEAEMAASHDGADRLEEYGHLQDELHRLGGYDVEHRIERVLDGLGFARQSWAMPVGQLSGGQKTRALMAKLLLEQPDVLILDEPTNHLDLEAIEWLEDMLRAWDGAFVISSHDRYFLDRVVNEIWEMARPVGGRARLEVYRGNYGAYLVQRSERFEREAFLFDQHKERLEHELEVIKRDLDFLKGMNGDKSVTWVKGKLKRLTRDVIAIEQLGVMAFESQQWMALAEQIEGSTRPWGYEEAERRVRALPRPAPPPRIAMTLRAPNRGSEQVVKAGGLAVGFAAHGRGRRLFVCDELQLMRGERVALIGANGTGKTTFVRTMLGALPPLAGEIELGPSVRPAYFAQAHDELDTRLRVIEELVRHQPGMSEEQARRYLAQYLFRADDVFKYVSGLSGGEKARLALAILSLKGANFLVLDEPTNHLDLRAQEVLQEALEAYDGTILLVSHDRYLIDRLATQVWEIRDGRLHVTRGTYQDYARGRERAMHEPASQTRASQTKASQTRAGRDKSAAPSKNGAQQRERARAEIETRIATLEAKLAKLGEDMQRAGAKGQHERARALGDEYASTRTELEGVMERWVEMA